MKKTIMLGVWMCLCLAGPAMALPVDKAPPAMPIEERITQIEDAMDVIKEEARWYDRLRISGLVEVEAGLSHIDFDDSTPDDERTSDVDLATVELALDVAIVTYVHGHVLLKYEDEQVFLDEGYIRLSGPQQFPAYLKAGRQYLPFGSFESHFISDPATLELGETNEGAVVVGYLFNGGMVDVAAGVFNGKTEKAGSHDMVDDYAAGIVVTPHENFTFGISYTSHLAAADALADQVATELRDSIAGWSAFASVTLLERVTVMAEYLAALEGFQSGELYSDSDAQRRRPAAWNLEMGMALTDQWMVALRYGGSSDGCAGGAGCAEFLAESQYGAVVNCALLKNTSLALEYMHSEYENGVQANDVLLAKLSVEF